MSLWGSHGEWEKTDVWAAVQLLYESSPSAHGQLTRQLIHSQTIKIWSYAIAGLCETVVYRLRRMENSSLSKEHSSYE